DGSLVFLSTEASEGPQPFLAESEEEAVEQARLYYSCADIVVVENVGEALRRAGEERGSGRRFIWRDEDVLDTWCSSALWPFSTLGWQEETAVLKRFYPTSVLVTACDIICLWVARMMMMGLHFMPPESPGEPVEKAVPFRIAFIHNRVLDEKGQKMSKTKGNV